MRCGKAEWLMLALILAPFPVSGDPERDEALRAIRDQAVGIHAWVESAERPAWLDMHADDSARAAGEALGQQQRERFREALPSPSACRDLGQLCPAGTAPDAAAPNDPAVVTVPVEQPGGQGTDAAAAPLRADDVTVTVLVSRSLGAAQLKEIFAFAADIPRVRVAFRGVAEDESLMDFVRGIHGLLAGIEPVPEAMPLS
jgi:conjugal transfer pilus assembly protein TraW